MKVIIEDEDNGDIAGLSVALVAESASRRSAMVSIKDILQNKCATVTSDECRENHSILNSYGKATGANADNRPCCIETFQECG